MPPIKLNSETRKTEQLAKSAETKNSSTNTLRVKSAARSPIGPLQAEGELIAEPSRMCELLKNKFESVFSVPQNTANIEALCNEAGPRCLENLCFDKEDIAQAIKSVPTHLSPGPDGIPAKLLKECTDELKKPISMLWRSSLKLGRVPHKLKQSHVIPIFKKGNRSSPQKFRPISLVSHQSNIFERVVVKNLTSYLNDLNLFTQQQHGFRSGRSCLSQLLEYHQKILAMLESRADLDVVYFDFARAFDKVDYGVLLSKPRSIGISGLVLQWFNSFPFLASREQTISIKGTLSSEGTVTSGVPQGSSLGVGTRDG